MKISQYPNFEEALENAPETKASFSAYSPTALSMAKKEHSPNPEYYVSEVGIMYRLSTFDGIPMLNQVSPGASLTSGFPNITIIFKDGTVINSGLTFNADTRSGWERIVKKSLKNSNPLKFNLAESGIVVLDNDRIVFSKLDTNEQLYHTKK